MKITDIAALAGVGVSTVSRVINNHPDVKNETRQKILEIIKENNYIPNNSARMLKQSQTKNIGLMVRGLFNPFFSEMLEFLNMEIEKAGYTTILQHYESQNDIEMLLGFIKEKRLQGVICLGGDFTDIGEDTFKYTDIPIVLLSVHMEFKKGRHTFSSIGIKDDIASMQATAYLLNQGHKKIGLMLGRKKDLGIEKLRKIGYEIAFCDVGEVPEEEYILYGEYDIEKAYTVAKEFLHEHKDVTAIFATSDIMAMGIAKAGNDIGLEIGKDLSIVGFEGLDIAKYYCPSITTVEQPRQQMCELALDLLWKLLKGEEKHKHILVDTKLQERQSCAKLI